jgi:hypothetical protein
MQVRFSEASERRLNIYASRDSDSFIVVRKPVNKMRSKIANHSGVGGAKGTDDRKCEPCRA